MIQEDSYFLCDGRPADLPCEKNELEVYDFLDKLGITYKTLKHPAAFSMEECRKVRDKINAPVAKNLFLTNKQQTNFYLLLMPADKVFKTKYLSAQINAARLSFAGEEHMNHLLGVKPGSVTPMGLINDKESQVKLLLDSDLKKEICFACHPGVNTASVVMTLKDFIEKYIPATGHDVQWVNLPWEIT